MEKKFIEFAIKNMNSYLRFQIIPFFTCFNFGLVFLILIIGLDTIGYYHRIIRKVTEINKHGNNFNGEEKVLKLDKI